MPKVLARFALARETRALPQRIRSNPSASSVNGADGISDIEGEAATARGERAGKRVSFNGAEGIGDIEGKVARVATSELGNERVSNPWFYSNLS